MNKAARIDAPPCFRFDVRTPMSYRATLRTIPRALRRSWWRQRYTYPEPRVPISRMWLLNHNRRV